MPFYLVAMGRHDEAVAEAKKALALDPVSLAAQTNVAIPYCRGGRFDEAVEEARRVLEIDTTYAHARFRQILGKSGLNR